MSRRSEIVDSIETIGAVAIVRTQRADLVGWAAGVLHECGVRAIEVTFTVPGACGVIRDLVSVFGEGHLIGAGSVCTEQDAREAIDAGAAYVVSPILNRDVIRLAHDHDVAAMPGCYTPNEIFAATQLEADVVKVFPADSLGPSYLRAVRAPMPTLRLMPTGGVTCENAGQWISAGAVAVGIGSALLDRHTLEQQDERQLRDRAATLLGSIGAARAGASS
ncbi:MAG: bifunctional 4-hydroxy-2-oxoglutarate aldolase/2-dehydro-3-deoxy-phosphogluconate aldolase [Planctomycetota bacterium]